MQGWRRHAWHRRQCRVRAAASPTGVVQASVATEAVLGSSRSVACRGGAGERGNRGSAGFKPPLHLQCGVGGSAGFDPQGRLGKLLVLEDALADALADARGLNEAVLGSSRSVASINFWCSRICFRMPLVSFWKTPRRAFSTSPSESDHSSLSPPIYLASTATAVSRVKTRLFFPGKVEQMIGPKGGPDPYIRNDMLRYLPVPIMSMS